MFNKMHTGYFGMTTMTGYHLSQHSGAFMELAPDKYATIRDVYLKHRARQIAETGSHSCTIWSALPELRQRTGLSFVDLSRELTHVSTLLIRQHPLRYSKTVVGAWVGFWKVPLYWDTALLHLPGDGKSPALVKTLSALWRPNRVFQRIINVAFLLIVLHAVVGLFRRQNWYTRTDWFVIMIVMVASVAQAFVEYGSTDRFWVPYEAMVIYLVASVSQRWPGGRRAGI